MGFSSWTGCKNSSFIRDVRVSVASRGSVEEKDGGFYIRRSVDRCFSVES